MCRVCIIGVVGVVFIKDELWSRVVFIKDELWSRVVFIKDELWSRVVFIKDYYLKVPNLRCFMWGIISHLQFG